MIAEGNIPFDAEQPHIAAAESRQPTGIAAQGKIAAPQPGFATNLAQYFTGTAHLVRADARIARRSQQPEMQRMTVTQREVFMPVDTASFSAEIAAAQQVITFAQQLHASPLYRCDGAFIKTAAVILRNAAGDFIVVALICSRALIQQRVDLLAGHAGGEVQTGIQRVERVMQQGLIAHFFVEVTHRRILVALQ